MVANLCHMTFLRNVLRKIPQTGDNKMHLSSNELSVWHGVSLMSSLWSMTPLLPRPISCSPSQSHCAFCLLQVRPNRSREREGQSAVFCSFSQRQTPGIWRVEVHTGAFKTSIFTPQERSFCESPMIWTHLKGKRRELYF